MATPMNVFSNKWSSEMDIEAYSLIHQYHLNTSLVGDVSQSLDLTNTCYYNFDASCNEDLAEETKPSNILNTTYTSPNIHLFSSSSSTSPLQNLQPSSIVLSFENSGSKSMNQSSSNFIFSTKEEEDESLKMMMTPRGTKRTSFTRSQQDHILAERKRREKLTQRFVALSALIPGLKKMDKISVLGDAIKHIKYLQESLKENEKQKKERTMESMVLVKKSHMDDDNQQLLSSFSYGDFDFSSSNLPEIEVRVSGDDVLIKILCEKQKVHVIKIMCEIEKFGLSITNSSVMPFGPTFDISIIAKKTSDFDIKIEDLMKSLSSVLPTFM